MNSILNPEIPASKWRGLAGHNGRSIAQHIGTNEFFEFESVGRPPSADRGGNCVISAPACELDGGVAAAADAGTPSSRAELLSGDR